MPQPLSAYVSLLSAQWRAPAAPKLNGWLAANLQLFQDLIACAATFPYAFSIDTAFGAQLDVLGVIIGQPRQVSFQPSDGVSPILDDPTYRLLLRARIAQNHWDGKLPSFLAIWGSLFPGGTIQVQDNQDMTADVYIAGAFTSIVIDLISQGYIMPRPQGVLFTYPEGGSPGPLPSLPFLGFDRSDSQVAGFDLAHFI
jgi:hypothetical protein